MHSCKAYWYTEPYHFLFDSQDPSTRLEHILFASNDGNDITVARLRRELNFGVCVFTNLAECWPSPSNDAAMEVLEHANLFTVVGGCLCVCVCVCCISSCIYEWTHAWSKGKYVCVLCVHASTCECCVVYAYVCKYSCMHVFHVHVMCACACYVFHLHVTCACVLCACACTLVGVICVCVHASYVCTSKWTIVFTYNVQCMCMCVVKVEDEGKLACTCNA